MTDAKQKCSFTLLNYEQQIEVYKQAAIAALRAYDLAGDSTFVEPLSFVNNATFKVQVLHTRDTVQQFALRIHRPGHMQIEAILSELQWLRAIQQDTTLRTPHPVPAKDGKYLISVSLPYLHQPIHCILFEWLEGRHLRTSQQTPALSYQVGEFIGALHQQSSQFRSTPELLRRRLDSDYLVEQRIFMASTEQRQMFTPEYFRLFRLVEERVKTVFDELDQESDSFGLIHADLIWKNYFFHEAGVGALDFDSCGWGYFLYDLAPALLGYRDEANYSALRQGFLSGYRHVRPLPVLQERYLDTLIAARHLVSCGWLISRLDNPTLLQRAPSIITYRTSEMCRLLAIPDINA